MFFRALTPLRLLFLAPRSLAEELERVRSYLDASTEPKITAVVEAQLVAEQMRALVEMEGSGLVALLADDKWVLTMLLHACMHARVGATL